jgi:chlorite dismutase
VADRSILSHFAAFAFEPVFWALPEDERAKIAGEWRKALGGAAEASHLYQTFGTRTDSDVLLWSTVSAENDSDAADFFAKFTSAMGPYREFVTMIDVLWGLTRPSQYARGTSEREIDPMGERTLQYLIVYPFVKTHEWYQMPPEERRRMMTSHIRVGKTHQGIDQLLLYSTGLQDQEFVVAYESDDLAAFSLLVSELRMTEARLYTERDTPVHVGMYVGPDEPTDSWL